MNAGDCEGERNCGDGAALSLGSLGFGVAQDLRSSHRALGSEVDQLVQAQDAHASEIRRWIVRLEA